MTSPFATRNLFSLNDRPFLVDMGSFGNWQINSKPEGAPWGVTVLEDRVVRVDLGDDKFENKPVEATTFANDIISRYSGEGVFLAAEDDSPTATEVEQASKEFELTDMARIADAHKKWDATHDRGRIDNQARDAARRRHQVVEWAVNVMVEQKNCPFCGEIIRASASKCKFCNEWLKERPVPAAAPVPVENPSTNDTATQVHALLTGKKR